MRRVALISSPRSGNTWTRYLLRDACGLEEFAENNPVDVAWESLPEDCVLQMHCHRDPAVLALLAEHGFACLHLARHPLDILLSILQCCEAVPETALWLAGEGGNEDLIRGRSPQDAEFMAYATGPRAAALLSVGPQWWSAAGDAVKVRYEDLVGDPVAVLGRALDDLGMKPVTPLADVVDANTIDRLRAFDAHFFWRGEPGLWRRVLTAGQCERIARAHPRAFAVGRYGSDADAALEPERARANWGAVGTPGSP